MPVFSSNIPRNAISTASLDASAPSKFQKRSRKVKIHYTFEGDTSVVATISANVSTIDFIMKGLPGQPENYKPTLIEDVEGTVLTDWSAKPPQTVYVVGIKKDKE